jgi:hypothetical protein
MTMHLIRGGKGKGKGKRNGKGKGVRSVRDGSRGMPEAELLEGHKGETIPENQRETTGCAPSIASSSSAATLAEAAGLQRWHILKL